MADDPTGMAESAPSRSERHEGNPFTPYLVVLGLAAFFALLVLAYVWSYRAEILRIVTQSPV